MKISWFTAILTSGFISLTMVTTVHLLRSKNSQRSIILWSPESIMERLSSIIFVRIKFKFTVRSFRRPKMKWATIHVMMQL